MTSSPLEKEAAHMTDHQPGDGINDNADPVRTRVPGRWRITLSRVMPEGSWRERLLELAQAIPEGQALRLAEYRIAFAPIGGRLRSRHVMVQGIDRLTAFLRQAHVPTPEIERAWRTLATRRVHSIPRVGLTPTQIAALGF
jgi:hypothetical protein